MTKELEALENIAKALMNSKEFKSINKSLKALEIIKESDILVVDDYLKMLRGVGGIDLTDEESDLLKEVLNEND